MLSHQKIVFTYVTATDMKLLTGLGVLSTVSSKFDPLGLLAPVTIQGKALLRRLTSEIPDRDVSLPEELKDLEGWRDSLQCLKQLHLPHAYIKAVYTELALFLVKAIDAVASLKVWGRVRHVQGQTRATFWVYNPKAWVLCRRTCSRNSGLQEEVDLKLDAVDTAGTMAWRKTHDRGNNVNIIMWTNAKFELVELENNLDIQPQVKNLRYLFGETAFLIHLTRSFKYSNQDSKCRRWHKCHQGSKRGRPWMNYKLFKLINLCLNVILCTNSAHLWRMD